MSIKDDCARKYCEEYELPIEFEDGGESADMVSYKSGWEEAIKQIRIANTDPATGGFYSAAVDDLVRRFA